MSSGYGALEALLTPDEAMSRGAPATPERTVAALLNPNPTVWISFAGGSNESVATFIQSVQRVAFMQNRIEDDKWMAQYTSTCFTDSALMWYLSLEEKAQTTWKNLRLALVQRYPMVQSPQPAPVVVPAKPEVPSPEITKIGQIEVIRAEFGEFFGYLSQDSTGKFVVDLSQEKALKLEAVLHTNAKNQHEKIYSLRLLDAPDPQYPFLGLKLVKLPGEDPDIVPLTKIDSSSSSWNYIRTVPSCCRPLARLTQNYGYGGSSETPYATWDFAQTTESRPGPYYVRKSEGQDPKARVVSAVWTLLNRVKDVTELGLTWPSGNHRQASAVSEIAIDPVIYKGEIGGLHAHACDFPKDSENYLNERQVVFLFRPIPKS